MKVTVGMAGGKKKHECRKIHAKDAKAKCNTTKGSSKFITWDARR